MISIEIYPNVRRPAQSTLDKYGLTPSEWLAMLKKQEGKCAICKREVQVLVVDHDHAPRWKHFPPERRKLYVRGLCCHTCNHYVLTRYGSSAKHRAAAVYLDRYLRRKKRFERVLKG